MQVKKCDRNGRLTLKKAIRRKYGERYGVVETADGVVLVPLEGKIGKALEAKTLKGIHVELKIEMEIEDS